MKTHRPFYLFATLIAAFAVSAMLSSAEEPAKKADSVVLHTVGKVEPALVKRLNAFVLRHGMLNARMGDPIAPAGTKLAQQAESVKGQVDKTAPINILLTNQHATDPAHLHMDPTNRIAVVNLASLRVDDKEVYERRIERQITRAIGFGIGLKPCPNPQCGLYPYKDLKKLDSIGRSFCPPCQMFMTREAKKKGVTLRDRTFNFVPKKPGDTANTPKPAPLPQK